MGGSTCSRCLLALMIISLTLVSVQAQKKKAGPPRDLAATSVTTSSIGISWRPPKKVPAKYPVSGYKVLYKLASDSSPKRLDIPDTNVHTISDLAAGSMYEIKMATITSNGKVGAFSDWIQVQTEEEQAAPPPNPPQSVTASVSGTSITVEWNPPHGSFDGYVVSYGVGSIEENLLEVGQEEQSVTLTGLQAGSTYQVALQSARGGVRSQPLNLNLETGVPVPSPPNTIRLRSTAESIDVEWSHSAVAEEGVTGFELSVGPDSNPTEQTMTLGSDDRYTTVSGLQPEQVYVVSVKAQNEYGDSQAISDKISTQAASSSGPSPPTGMQMRADAESIEVYWGEPAGDVTGYILNVGPGTNPTQITERIPRGTSNYRVGGLDPSTEYTVSLRSFDSGGESQPLQQSVRTQAAQGPLPPSGMRLNSRLDSIDVMWGEAGGDINGYRLDVSTATNPLEYSQGVPAGTTSHTIPNLEPNTEYQVSLVSVGRNGVSQPLRQVIRTMNVSPPQSIRLRSSDSTISVTWPASRENIDGYNLKVNPAGRPNEAVYKETLAPSDESHTVDGLDAGTDYTVSLTSYKGDATSPPIQQTIRTMDAPVGPMTGGGGGTPASPTGVHVSTEGNNLRVRWNPSSEELSGYVVRAGRATSGAAGEIQQNLNPNKSQFLLRNLQPSTDYLVSVSTVNSAGESAPTIVSARTESPLPGRPEGLASETTHHSASLTWRAPGSPIDGYILSLGTVTYPRQYTESLPASATSYTFEGLEPDTSYQAELQSFNDVGSSQPITRNLRTEPTPPPTLPDTPSVLHLTARSTRINVQWMPVSGPVEGYSLIITDQDSGESETVELDQFQQNYAFTNLAPGKMYEVSIQSFNEDGYSDPLVQTTSTDMPSGSLEPQNVEVIATGTQIDVSWDPPSRTDLNVVSYVLEAAAIGPEGPLGPRESLTLHPSQEQHTFYNLQPATTYRVSVAANQEGSLSRPVVMEVRTSIDGPMPPINVMADPISPNAVSVSWDFPVPTGPPASGGRRPDIYYTVRASSPEAGDIYANSREMSVNVEGLRPDTLYEVQVAMVFNGLISDYGGAFAVRTFSNVNPRSPQFPTVTQVLLEIPENVHVTFNWLTPREGVEEITGYKLEYTLAEDPSLDNTTWESVRGDAADLGVVVSGLPTSATVSYRVQPTYRGGEQGPFSTTGVFSTPLAERPVPDDEPCQSLEDVTRQRINQITERVVPPLGIPLPYCDQFFTDFPCVWSPVCICIPRGTQSLGALPNSVRPTDGPGCVSTRQRDDPAADEPQRPSGPAPCQLVFDQTLAAIRESHKNTMPLMASALPNCREDGYYDSIQCMGSMCLCVDEMGQPMGKMTQLWKVHTLNCDS